MQYCSKNPATGVTVSEFPFAADAEVEEALVAAEASWRGWRKLPTKDRAEKFLSLAAIIEKQVEPLARLISEEMGKPISQSLAEIRKCSSGCRTFAEACPQWLADDARPTDATRSFISYRPIGPVLAILPWNYPFWQFFRFAVPALIAGNVVVVKHAPNVPRCAAKIIELFNEAGFDPLPVTNLYLTNDQAARVIGDPRISGVTITGSGRAGREVATAAGRALKKVVLELGGSDPFVVFSDADLETAVEVAVTSRFANSGQVCIAAKRLMIEQSVFERFSKQFIERVSALRLGDPVRHCTDLGPIARADLLENLSDQLARVQFSGEMPAFEGSSTLPPEFEGGFFRPPSVFINPRPDSPLLTEEIFGPVGVLIPFSDENQALQIANCTRFGLGASIWTTDSSRIERLATELEFGSVFFNGMVRSDPRLPFGGTKDSGFGRELGPEGTREFTNIKTIWIK